MDACGLCWSRAFGWCFFTRALCPPLVCTQEFTYGRFRWRPLHRTVDPPYAQRQALCSSSRMSVEILCRCLVVLLRRYVCLLSSRAGNRLMYERLVPEAAACYQTALEIYFGRRAEQVQALNVVGVR